MPILDRSLGRSRVVSRTEKDKVNLGKRDTTGFFVSKFLALKNKQKTHTNKRVASHCQWMRYRKPNELSIMFPLRSIGGFVNFVVSWEKKTRMIRILTRHKNIVEVEYLVYLARVTSTVSYQNSSSKSKLFCCLSYRLRKSRGAVETISSDLILGLCICINIW